ncbi:hypothetical protein GCM10022218_04160 [Sphingobacterium ginsenosidimutans]|uniref:Tox-URI2 domain-containing protein n=1 Tax=Sphingobacterium ginsenosidimutans TaxID=687845 RepID=A0ABP7ZRJ6_9SPHI
MIRGSKTEQKIYTLNEHKNGTHHHNKFAAKQLNRIEASAYQEIWHYFKRNTEYGIDDRANAIKKFNNNYKSTKR